MSWHYRRLGIVAAALCGAFLLLAFGERLLWRGRVLPGVQLVGVSVSGKDLDDAAAAIRSGAGRLEGGRLVATAAGRSLTFTPRSVGLEIDDRAAVLAVQRTGRHGHPLAQAAGFVLRRFRPDRVTFRARYDDGRLAATVDRWARQIDASPRSGAVRIALDDHRRAAVVVDPPEDGRRLDRAASVRLVAEALRAESAGPVRLPVITSAPPIGRAEVRRAETELKRILGGSATLEVGGRTITLPPARLSRLLRVNADGSHLRTSLPVAALHHELRPDLAGLEVPAQDARFLIEGEPPAVRIEPSANGRELDTGPVAAALLRGERRITGVLHDLAPRIDTARAQALRIIEPVSTFTTNHPAGQARVKNIHRAADLLQGYVILPGEQFSMNKVLGRRTKAAGFVKAPVIYEGEFTEDIGGGVSQFATTFFNSAFFGGYKLVEHRAHSFYISRYPRGREATVSFPAPDLRIENDSSSGIVVQTSYTESSITVTFWGDREGRVVRAEGPDVGKKSDAGYSVIVWRVIERPGQPAERQRFVTHYRIQPKKTPAPPKPTASPSSGSRPRAAVSPIPPA